MLRSAQQDIAKVSWVFMITPLIFAKLMKIVCGFLWYNLAALKKAHLAWDGQ
jgi:hypothetical protein